MNICAPGNVCSADGNTLLVYEHPGGSNQGNVSGVCLSVSLYSLMMARIKTGETRKTRQIANCEGTYVALHAQRQPKDRHEREMPKMLNMLREMCPELPDTFLQDAPSGFEDGSMWALVEMGGTYTKICCEKKPCNHECQAEPRQACCPARKILCIDGNFRFLHVSRLADVIPLRFAVRMRPMQGMFRALLPAAAIPTDSMTGAQLR